MLRSTTVRAFCLAQTASCYRDALFDRQPIIRVDKVRKGIKFNEFIYEILTCSLGFGPKNYCHIWIQAVQSVVTVGVVIAKVV